MAIRSWSFTKFWAVSTILWFITAGLDDINHYYRSLGLLQVIFAFSPAFLAGAWAGSHPEIAQWPRVRIVTIWTMVLLVFAALNDTMNGWNLPLILIGAPATIFTLRWYELTGGRPQLREPHQPVIPPDTPPNGSLVS